MQKNLCNTRITINIGTPEPNAVTMQFNKDYGIYWYVFMFFLPFSQRESFPTSCFPSLDRQAHLKWE